MLLCWQCPINLKPVAQNPITVQMMPVDKVIQSNNGRPFNVGPKGKPISALFWFELLMKKGFMSVFSIKQNSIIPTDQTDTCHWSFDRRSGKRQIHYFSKTQIRSLPSWYSNYSFFPSSYALYLFCMEKNHMRYLWWVLIIIPRRNPCRCSHPKSSVSVLRRR